MYSSQVNPESGESSTPPELPNLHVHQHPKARHRALHGSIPTPVSKEESLEGLHQKLSVSMALLDS